MTSDHTRDTLFLSGDYEAQKMCADVVKIQPFLERHFLYSVLISDSVNMPAGCYYQSECTQSLLHRYERLYLPAGDHAPVAELSIGDDRSSFSEDVEIKKSWFPEKYGYTDDESTASLTKQLRNIQPRIRSGKMRKKLTARISDDLAEGSQIRTVLGQVLESQEQAAAFVQPLKKVIEVQEYAILPTYVEIELERHGLSTKDGRRRWLDFILFKGYSQSCEEAYQCYCNNPLSIFYDRDFRRIYPYRLDYRDTNLFQAFLRIFPFRGLNHLERLSSDQLMEIKYSTEFRYYLRQYQKLVELLKDELQIVLVGREGGYSDSQTIFEEYGRRELESCKQVLLQSTQDAIILYKILKNPFIKNERFREWAAKKTEFPTLQLLSCVEDGKNGIFQEYICEFFRQSKEIYKRQKRDNTPKSNVFNFAVTIGNNNGTTQTGASESGNKAFQQSDLVAQRQQEDSMKNFAFTIGKDNHTEQKNEIHSSTQASVGSGGTVSISQTEFQAVPAEALELFKAEIYKDVDIDKSCREAVLTVLNAKYCTTREEYEEALTDWRKRKETFSHKARERIGCAAAIANIGSFIMQLMAL